MALNSATDDDQIQLLLVSVYTTLVEQGVVPAPPRLPDPAGDDDCDRGAQVVGRRSSTCCRPCVHLACSWEIRPSNRSARTVSRSGFA
jgi:hypothetical protein